jgi:hypothetical protein
MEIGDRKSNREEKKRIILDVLTLSVWLVPPLLISGIDQRRCQTGKPDGDEQVGTWLT